MDSRVSLVDIHLVSNKLSTKRMSNLTLFLVSFSGLMFLAFYIAGKMKMFDQKGVS